MLDWMGQHKGLLWVIGTGSIVLFVASLFAIPPLVVRIPADYFTHAKRPPSPWANERPFVRVAVAIAKNIFGGILMLAGLLMFLLPGQGMLTLLIGFLLIDFPGKYRFEKWLIGRSYIHRPINWIRRRRKRPPLKVPSVSA
jgi:hypothetical protein